MRLVSLAAALASLSSCMSFNYDRHRALEPLDHARFSALRPNESDLGACLAALGAPLYVWEHHGNGLALGYAWQQERHWSAGVRFDLVRGTSASFNYTDIDASTQGFVLFFDEHWKLCALREGCLRDITTDVGPRRPADVGE